MSLLKLLGALYILGSSPACPAPTVIVVQPPVYHPPVCQLAYQPIPCPVALPAPWSWRWQSWRDAEMGNYMDWWDACHPYPCCTERDRAEKAESERLNETLLEGN